MFSKLVMSMLQCQGSIPKFLLCSYSVVSEPPMLLLVFKPSSSHGTLFLFHSQDVLLVCSSTGWTDEKHLLYLRLLEESFASRLHAGECQYKGLLSCSSRSCVRIDSSKQIVKYEYADQV
jgi:hypothetical protein